MCVTLELNLFLTVGMGKTTVKSASSTLDKYPEMALIQLTHFYFDSKSKPQTSHYLATMKAIKEKVPGNRFCADCDGSNPDWASLK